MIENAEQLCGSEAELEEHFHAIGVMNIAFAKLSCPRRIADSTTDPRIWVIENASDLASTESVLRCDSLGSSSDQKPRVVPFIVNRRGSWLDAAAKLLELGWNWCVVNNYPTTDESRTPWRVSIPVDEYSLLFVPNYKAGYSSIRAMCIGKFQECASRDDGRSAALNRLVDLERARADGNVAVSIVRDPVARFESFFADKLNRESDHRNTYMYYDPMRRLAGVSRLTECDVLELVAKIPSEYSDPHWKSQYANLHHAGHCLVDHVLRLENIDAELGEVGKALGIDLHLRPANTAVRSEQPALTDGDTYPNDLAQRVRDVYANDVEMFGYA